MNSAAFQERAVIDLGPEDLFESTLARVLGERMHVFTDDDVCHQVWSALTNVDWVHDSGKRVCYSFRAAGSLIAAIRGHGSSYLDWYCRSPDGHVSDLVRDAMAPEGWHPVLLGYEPGEP